ncbi:MAG: M48 family metallopeptidase [Clostridiaceae bacterium]|nr:M48 family metallopeptidase [Clostridiaceae bacterium]
MKTEKYFIEYKNTKIFYTLTRSNRKTIGLKIDKNGEVKVSVPLRLGKKQIEEAIRGKADWIINKIYKVREMNLNIVPRKFVSGEKLLYLGKEYILKVVDRDITRPEVCIQNDTISVYISQSLTKESRKQAVKETLIKWYRQYFSEIVNDRIEKYSLKLNATPCKVVIKDQKTRWGSCSVKGNINLNWRLVMAPVDIIDYVVVHELCHLKIMNHSKDFWLLVESVLPCYKEKRKWLKTYGYKLAI